MYLSSPLLLLLISLLIDEKHVVAFTRGQRAHFDGVLLYSTSQSIVRPIAPTGGISESTAKSLLMLHNFQNETIILSRSDAEPYKRSRIPYDIILRTLIHYKSLHGDMLVPQWFVVPSSADWPQESWDMKLGQTVSYIRKGTYPKKRMELQSMGFCFSALDAKYLLAKTALLTFQNIYGNMLVQSSFIVPSDSILWPQEVWGLKLGMIVRNIRRGDSYVDKRDELIKMGFTFSVEQEKYELTKIALLRYKKIYGDMLVPFNFEVPTDNEKWPKKTWGLRLGNIVGTMRRGSYPDKHDELVEIGFDFSNQMALYGYTSTRQALLIYRNLYGNMNVPDRFTIPINDIWPQKSWGMKLGYRVKDLRYGRVFADRKEDLEKIGFDFTSIRKKNDFSVIYRALMKYKELFGDLLVPQLFVIPSDSSDWPVDLWGINLGSYVGRIRGGYFSDKKEELLSIGFSFCVRKKFDYDSVKCAINCYKKLYGSTCIPETYKIVVGMKIFPEKTWGMWLGRYVRKIKSGVLWPNESHDFLN